MEATPSERAAACASRMARESVASEVRVEVMGSVCRGMREASRTVGQPGNLGLNDDGFRPHEDPLPKVSGTAANRAMRQASGASGDREWRR